MKTMKSTLSSLAILALVLAGCSSELTGSDATTKTDIVQQDTTPACLATATTKQEACYEFKDTLCERFLSDDCETFASTNECDTWFEDTFFTDCGDASTDALPAGVKEGDLTTCVCNIPDANCDALSDPGPDVAIPACGDMLDALLGS